MAKKIQVKDVFSGRRGSLDDSEYNSRMQQWSTKVQQMAKAEAAAFSKGKKRSHTYVSGPKKGKTEYVLRNHIQYQLKSDSGEVAGVAFQFPVHGIFREYGIGRGTPRSMVGHSSRSMSEWISGTLQSKEQELIDIVAEYQSGKVLRTFRSIRGKTSSWNIKG